MVYIMITQGNLSFTASTKAALDRKEWLTARDAECGRFLVCSLQELEKDLQSEQAELTAALSRGITRSGPRPASPVGIGLGPEGLQQLQENVTQLQTALEEVREGLAASERGSARREADLSAVSRAQHVLEGRVGSLASSLESLDSPSMPPSPAKAGLSRTKPSAVNLERKLPPTGAHNAAISIEVDDVDEAGKPEAPPTGKVCAHSPLITSAALSLFVLCMPVARCCVTLQKHVSEVSLKGSYVAGREASAARVSWAKQRER